MRDNNVRPRYTYMVNMRKKKGLEEILCTELKIQIQSNEMSLPLLLR